MKDTGVRRGSDASEGAGGGDAEALRRIIERNADGMVVLDRQGRVCFANESAARLFGESAERLIGVELGLPAGAGETSIVDIPSDDGQRVAELRVVEMDWKGEPARLVSLRDVTERRQAEQRERELAVEQSRRLDAERRASRSAFRATIATALEKSLALGINLHELTQACCSTGFSDWCAVDLLEDGQVVRRSASVEAPDVRPADLDELSAAELSITPVTDGEERQLEQAVGGEWSQGTVASVPVNLQGAIAGILVFARRDRDFEADDIEMAYDVANRVAISISHARLYEEAQRAAHAKSQFLAVMSHELRTPLNAVIGYSDLLLMDIAGPMNEKQRDIIGKVQNSSKHLISLVEEILTYTRMERGQEELILEDVAVGAIVGETVDMISPMARASGLEFRSSIDEPKQMIRTDTQKLRQVLTNLLTNAIKYTETGFVALRVRPDGDGIEIVVEDSGIGMSHEHIEHIYEPFWQVEPTNTRRRGGTGLGLTVAMQLTRLLGGRLSVESVPGDGTSFTLQLPAAPPAAKTV